MYYRPYSLHVILASKGRWKLSSDSRDFEITRTWHI